MFSVLLSEAPDSQGAREIVSVRGDAVGFINEGNLPAAAQRFIDYWMGAGAWAATPEARRAVLLGAVRNVKPEWHSAFNEPTPLEAFRQLDVPVLLLSGTRSTAAARGVAALLAKTLPRVQVEAVEGAGHMAPVTDPARINPLIERFLSAH